MCYLINFDTFWLNVNVIFGVKTSFIVISTLLNKFVYI